MLLNGSLLAGKIRRKLKIQIKTSNVKPGLAIILVGDDSASCLYVKLKSIAASEVGIYFEQHWFPVTVSEKEIIDLINKLNRSENIHGILVQLPLPSKFNQDRIIVTIKPCKDVDGFCSKNLKNLVRIKTTSELSTNHIIIPALIRGILELIKLVKIKLATKKAVIICNSQVFATPMAHLLQLAKMSVAVCVRFSGLPKDKLYTITKDADLLIVAIGSPRFVVKDMVKLNSIIIDIGTNQIGNGTVGDVDFDAVKNKVSAITPVPGGVGPMTIACLLQNTYEATILAQENN